MIEKIKSQIISEEEMKETIKKIKDYDYSYIEEIFRDHCLKLLVQNNNYNTTMTEAFKTTKNEAMEHMFTTNSRESIPQICKKLLVKFAPPSTNNVFMLSLYIFVKIFFKSNKLFFAKFILINLIPFSLK